MALVAERIHVPIATGERLHSIWEYQALLQRGAVQYVRPDVCMVGGISHARKIAALAEAFHVQVVPHNPLSPVSTAACIQLAAAIPNFALQELPVGEEVPPKRTMVDQPLVLDGGFSRGAGASGHRHRAGAGRSAAASLPAARGGDAPAQRRLGDGSVTRQRGQAAQAGLPSPGRNALTTSGFTSRRGPPIRSTQ